MSNFNTDLDAGETVETLATVFKALSNPNRLKIYLGMLPCMAPGEVCVTSNEEVEAFQLTIAEKLGLAPSTVSHHLKELRNAGLVKMKRSGKTVEITLVEDGLDCIRAFVEQSG